MSLSFLCLYLLFLTSEQRKLTFNDNSICFEVPARNDSFLMTPRDANSKTDYYVFRPLGSSLLFVK